MKNTCHEYMADMSNVVRTVVLTAVLLEVPEDFNLLECYAAWFGEQKGVTVYPTCHNILEDCTLHFQY
jgi:hypothetical protein